MSSDEERQIGYPNVDDDDKSYVDYSTRVHPQPKHPDVIKMSSDDVKCYFYPDPDVDDENENKNWQKKKNPSVKEGPSTQMSKIMERPMMLGHESKQNETNFYKPSKNESDDIDINVYDDIKLGYEGLGYETESMLRFWGRWNYWSPLGSS